MRPDVFDIDLYVDGQVSGNDHTIDKKAVEAIHNRGAHAICYMSAGTAERFRPDFHKYVRFNRRHHHGLIGSRSAAVSRTVLAQSQERPWAARLRPAPSRARTAEVRPGRVRGVEYDVVDAYAQGHRVTGWQITAHNQLVFDRALARSPTGTASRWG